MVAEILREEHLRHCKQYGPGRLPGADRPARGAGYAFATAALAGSLTFSAVMGVLAVVGLAVRGVPTNNAVALLVIGLVAVPVAVPSAFLAAELVWRCLPTRGWLDGAADGLAVTLCTYVVAGTLMSSVGLPVIAVLGSVSDIVTLVLGAYGIAGAALALTFWVTLPLGPLSGYIHHWARTEAA